MVAAAVTLVMLCEVLGFGLTGLFPLLTAEASQPLNVTFGGPNYRHDRTHGLSPRTFDVDINNTVPTMRFAMQSPQTLEYPIADGRLAQWTVFELSDQTIRVEYREFTDSSYDSMVNIITNNLTRVFSTSALAPTEFVRPQLHESFHPALSFPNQYVVYSDILDLNDDLVIDPRDGAPLFGSATSNALVFHVTRGNGFSFQVDGYNNTPTVTSSFMVVGNEFVITTNSVYAGRFYDLTLYGGRDIYDDFGVRDIKFPRNATSSHTETVFSGLDVDGVHMERINVNTFSDGKGINNVINWTNSPYNEFPGKPDNVVRVTVPLPLVWNQASEAFTLPPNNTVFMNYFNDVEIHFNSSLPDSFGASDMYAVFRSFQFNGNYVIDPVQRSNINSFISNPILNPIPVLPPVPATQGVFTFDINFDETQESWASTIFTNSTLRLQRPGSTLRTFNGDSRLPQYEIYTFLEMEYQYQGEASWLMLRPYNVPGYYMLTFMQNPSYRDLFDTDPFEALEIRQVTQEMLDSDNFSLWFPIDTRSIGFYRIVFKPGAAGFTSTERNEPRLSNQTLRNSAIFSQSVFYTMSDHKFEPGNPTTFTITNFGFIPHKNDGRPPMHLRDGMGSPERNLGFNMSWNISTYYAVAAMIRTAMETPMVDSYSVFYEFNVRESPLDEPEKQVFAQLMVTYRFADPILGPGGGGVVGANGEPRITAEFNQVRITGTPALENYEIVHDNDPESIFYNFELEDITAIVIDPQTGESRFYDEDTGRVKGNLMVRTYAYPRGFAAHAIPDPSGVGAAVWPVSHFRYPNVYFLNVDLVEKASGAASLFGSITLNDAFSNVEIPMITDVTLTEISLAGPNAQERTDGLAAVGVRWTVPSSVILSSLQRLPAYSQYNLEFNIYISSDEERILNLANPGGPSVTPRVFAFDDTQHPLESAGIFHFSPPATPDPAAPPPTVFEWHVADQNGNYAIDALRSTATRNGEVVKISGLRLFDGFIPMNGAGGLADLLAADHVFDFVFEGLDRNQTYYISFDISVELWDEEEDFEYPTALPFWDLSGDIIDALFDTDTLDETAKIPIPAPDDLRMSAIRTVTTWGALTPPTPGDRVPPAPVLRRGDVGFSTAEIIWRDIVETVTAEYGVLGYEMIVLRNRQMERQLLGNTTLTFGQVYNRIYSPQQSDGKRGFSLGEPISPLGIWNENASPPGFEDEQRGLLFGLFGPDMIFTDNELAPNNIYYYYVRTVRVIDGVPVAYSSWSEIAVTTTPVRPPVELTVRRDVDNVLALFRSQNKNIVFNAQNNVFLEFYAPANPAFLGVDYNLHISLRRDNDPWTDNPWNDGNRLNPLDLSSPNLIVVDSKFINVNGIEVEHWRYIYRVTGLSPGLNYSFRVRTENIEHKDFSVWSNVVIARTEFNQDEFDRDRDRDSWADFLMQNLRVIFNDSFWIAQSTGSAYVTVLRPSVYPSVFARSVDSMIVLEAPPDAGFYQFYIPQSILAEADALEKGFMLKRGNVETYIMPRTLARDNPALLNAIERINSRNTPAADYYLRLDVTFTTIPMQIQQGILTPTLIDGRTPASDRIEVNLNIVTARATARDWDNGIINMIARYLADDDNFTDAYEEFRRRVARGESSEQILRYLDGYVRSVLPLIYAQINNNLRTTLDAVFAVHTFNRPMRISLNNVGPRETIGGYQLLNTRWTARPVQNQNNGAWAMDITQGGTYVFNTLSMSYAGIEQLPFGDRMSGLITQYGLADFFGRFEAFNMNANLTLHALAGTAARVGGGSGQVADNAAFLRGRGYNVTVRNTTQAATAQEAVYLLMAIYEMRTNTRVDNIQITNFGATSGIRGIEPMYLRSVQAAFELGVAVDRNMNPNGTITVREFFDMLGRLDTLVRL
jgi:hypothetical protein